MKRHLQAVLGGLAMLIAGGFITPARAALIQATDVNPDPNIFEVYLTAMEQDLTIAGTTVHAMVYKDDPPSPFVSAGATIPSPVIKVKLGDMIICHFKNNLSVESASIHWHGIELDNDSDGTAVTQDVVLPGQSYTYRFKTFRPGLFWYHSHMLPGNTTFAGMYGVIIIENPIEAQLIADGILPAEADTYTLALSDIEFDSTGKVGKPFGGVTTSVNELVELCHLDAAGEPGGSRAACMALTVGATVLVNGETPDLAAQTPKFTVPSGKRIRLRLANEAIARHFRLSLLNSGDNKLYRIGGQGGLLDKVRLEGGPQGTWDTKFDLGEIVVGSGERSDVIIVPTGNQGDIIQLVGNKLPDPFKFNTTLPLNYPIAFFEINGVSTDTPPHVDDPILAGTVEDIENIKTAATVGGLISPAPSGGSSDPTIHLTNVKPTGFANMIPAIDGYGFPTSVSLDSNLGNGDFLNMPHPPTARYAHVGDLLELAVRNETTAAHPYHLHGFSLQPVRVEDLAGTVLYNFDYDEFLDTIDVYGLQTLVFRVRLDDRPKFCDQSPSFPPGPVLATCSESVCGGAVGRWLFHCHIFSHGDLGMISELDVLGLPDNTPPTISNYSVDPPALFPPNHTMRDVTVNYDATDNCGTPDCALTVSSNEPVNGLGDGDTAPDWEIVDAHHVRLRAERAGNGNGRVYTITITCTDSSGNVATQNVTVNVAHNITGPPSGAAFKVGTTVKFAGQFWDIPGAKHTAQWTFDTVTQAGTVVEPTSSKPGSVSGAYTFTAAGVYLVKLTVTDSRGLSDTSTMQGDIGELVVIYDPKAGYVLGSGSFDSPAGAFTSNPSLAGKAGFGFVSQYFKAAPNPKGNTAFNLKIAGLEFVSLNYSYLAVSGARAQYKGFGKINGDASYNFILTVLDGQAAGGGGVDKLRMKIWNKNTGAVVYDSQPGAPDNADPSKPVASGSAIQIQY